MQFPRLIAAFASVISIAVVQAGASPLRAQVIARSLKDIEFLSLVLISGDLERATTMMNLLDKDDDGTLNEKEQGKLSWSYDPLKFDLDRSGDLTHFEVAMRFAFRRALAGVEEQDEAYAKHMMRSWDRNENLVLDVAEIQEQRWPDDPPAYDIDRNGRLDEYEVVVGVARERLAREEAGVTPRDYDQAMWAVGRFDKKRDRRLDRNEFAESLHSLAPLDWAEVDKNKDGLLSATELAFALTERRKKHGITPLDQANAWDGLRRADRNNKWDWVLDADEILRYQWPEFPDQYDSDKNQRLTRFELEVGLGAKRKKIPVTNGDGAQAMQLIRRLDRNRNGQIEIDELNQAQAARLPDGNILNTLHLYDSDMDRIVTQRELAIFFAMRRQE